MSLHSQRRQPIPGRYSWWRTLHLWQRVIVVCLLLGALVIAAGLIYFEPGAAGAFQLAPTAPSVTTTPGPVYPPGTDEYWYWGQNQPLNLQP
jgi:hypothetical protein